MAEKKLSEELKFCIEQDGCSKCSCFETQSKLTCPGLLQKAYEVVKRHEEMFPCNVGDAVYYRYDGIEIAPMRVEEIIITKYGANLLLSYCGDDEKLKYWKINIESTAINCKIIFLTKEAAEKALKEMEDRKNGEIN